MVKENIAKVKERIIAACLKARRDPAVIKLVVVSKNRGIEEIKEAALAGITDFGENRVQEAFLKYRDFPAIKWHMVGHLQTNKTKEAVRIFDLIQSVDSLRLAAEINKEALKIDKVQDILLEVKVSYEATKIGLKLEDVPGAVDEISGLKNINIKGLMAIAPLLANPAESRPYFRILRELRDSLNRQMILSIGMSDDFEVAIEEGSDMLRLGRCIFA